MSWKLETKSYQNNQDVDSTLKEIVSQSKEKSLRLSSAHCRSRGVTSLCCACNVTALRSVVLDDLWVSGQN